jgi:dTDP-4-amino-4,6-dideoxygalactose transaminase
MMQVPFLNLKAQHDSLRTELLAAIQEVIDASAFAGGPFVARFEEDFAAYCGASYALGLGHGTEALWLGLLGMGVRPGDEVITVPSTFMATAEAITYCGAKPVFVDIEDRTYTMDPAGLEKAITSRTKAIIPVHLFGQVADMGPILEIAGRHGLPVLEDACQAHGAEYRGRRAGVLGRAGCFSFYPGKNLGAMGEGGALVTNDAALKDYVAMMRDHGQRKKYYHELVGWNGRMDGIQGAVLRVKLKHLERGNEARRQHAALYGKLLAGLKELRLPVEAPERKHVWHVYAVRVRQRDALLERLGKAGIHCGIHYPVPVHLQHAYRELGLGPGSFPVAERCAQEFLSLPMFPELTQQQVQAVSRELELALRELR